jgi:hypothetical protein
MASLKFRGLCSSYVEEVYDTYFKPFRSVE